MSISDGQLANATNFNAAFISKTTASAGPVLETVTVSNTYTALPTDSVIICDGTSTAFTVSLPTAVGIEGKVYHIKRKDNTFANVITIDPNGSQLIDASSTKTLATYYEAWTIMSDGANWIVLDHDIHGVPFSVTFTGTWSTNTTYSGTCSRRGGYAFFNVGIALAGAPTSAPLQLTMPTGLTVSTSGFDSGIGIKQIGYGIASDVGVATYPLIVTYYSSTVIDIRALVASGTYTTATNVTEVLPFTFGNADGLRLTFECRITNFNG